MLVPFMFTQWFNKNFYVSDVCLFLFTLTDQLMLLSYPRRTFHVARLYGWSGRSGQKAKILEKVSPDLCYVSEFTQMLVFEMLYDLSENLPALSKQWALIPGSVTRAVSNYLLYLLKANPAFSMGSQQLDFSICVPVLSDYG